MQDHKIRKFMTLAGQTASEKLRSGSPEERKLGAHLLLSEVLEYVIKGLGVTPQVAGQKITDPEALQYLVEETSKVSPLEMLDGLADVAYTMYWNSVAFGIPLEEGFELVCDNNLEKFVHLEGWQRGELLLDPSEWHCECGIAWPKDVVSVEVLRVNNDFFAVGKDMRRKVRKPSSYRAVNLKELVQRAA